MYHQIGGVPAWDSDGYIPAIWPGERRSSRARAPYVVSLPDLVSLYGHSSHRRSLLAGLVEYRSLLHRAGLVRGFQWIDGSVVRNVEEDPEQSRDLGDVDVVTFFYAPENATPESVYVAFPMLHDFGALKGEFQVDAYYVQLDHTSPEDIVSETTYWYSMWSHTLEGRWKGYVQVDLAGDTDELVRSELDRLDAEGRAA